MKIVKITMVSLLFVAASGLSSCGKKYNKPDEPGKQSCSKHDDTESAPTATASSSGT